MSQKSLRKRKKSAAQSGQQIEKINANLHLIAGEHRHNHTHSITPISADEIEKLHVINPEFAIRLFNIMEDALEAEKNETKSFYAAVEREQENDKLGILKQSQDNEKAIKYSFYAILLLMTCGTGLIFAGYEIIGGAIDTTVLLGVVKAILTKKANKEEDKN